MKRALIPIIFLFLISSCTQIKVGDTGDLYYCVSRDIIDSCDAGFSAINDDGIQTRCYYWSESGIKRYFTCDEGWVLYTSILTDFTETPEIAIDSAYCGPYKCYKGKDYCRLDGLIINPQVKRTEVC